MLGDACPPLDVAAYDVDARRQSRTASATTRSARRIDHVDGVTVEEAEHQIATRLYQNTARIHFNQFAAAQGRFGRRLIYGGHVISLARALSFNGLANAFHIAAINGGRHVAPLFAGGDRVRLVARCWPRPSCPAAPMSARCACARSPTKDRPCARFPATRSGDDDDPAVLLDLDYWVLMPRVGHAVPSPRRCSTHAGAHRAAARSRLRMQIVRLAHRPRVGRARPPRSPWCARPAARCVSGTMPMPTLHSTRRHTASKLRNCTRSRSGAPDPRRLVGEEALQRARAVEADRSRGRAPARTRSSARLASAMVARHHQHEAVACGTDRSRARSTSTVPATMPMIGRRLRRSGRRSRR